LNQRLDVVVGASYAGGSKSLNKRDYRTGAASARLQYALWQNMAAYAQYFYYYYDYDDDFVLPSGYPPQQERQGFRAGLSFWVPLMR
jgi:hypothetical protein